MYKIFKSKIFRLFPFSTLAVMLALVISFGWVTLKREREGACKESLQQLTIAANGAKAQILEYLKYLKSQAASLYACKIILNDLKRIHNQPENKRILSELNRHLAYMNSGFPECVEIFILDASGKVISSTDARHTGKDHAHADYFLNGQKTVFVSDIFREKETGRVTWIVSSPMIDSRKGKLLGILACRINPVTLSNITTERKMCALGIKTQSLLIGKTGETYLVNRDKRMITESRLLDDVILKQAVDTTIVHRTLKDGETTAQNYLDYRNNPVFGASTVITETGWMIISERNSEEAFPPVRRLRNTIFAGGGAAAASIFLALWILIFRLTKPVRRLVQADTVAIKGSLTDALIPDDEMGETMHSRNAMLMSLKESEEIRKLSAAVEQSINIIFITDTQGHIEYVNPAFERVTGYSRAEILGKTMRIFDSGETAEVALDEMLKTITTGKTWKGTFKNKKRDGQYYWCESLITPICNVEGQITNFLSVQEDITEKMKLKEEVNIFGSYASFDGLTGLYNRIRFMELIEDWTISAKAHHYSGALLMIDIDKFRLINDTYGSKVGDELLQRMARYLQDVMSEIDTEYFSTGNKVIMESLLCHMGGDEFAVFLSSRNEKEAMETAEKIRRRMESFQLEGWTGHITVSVGITLYPAHGETVYELLKKADASIFSAKELGRNRSRVYQPEDLVLEKMHTKVEWKWRIQKALREDRFVLWFQPLLDLKNDTIYHYEVLVRMRDEAGGIVLPGAFIDTAEAVGLIRDIDRVVITKTMRYQAMRKKQGRRVEFSMNLSGKELGEKELLDFLRDSILELSIDAENLNFEITETDAIHDLNRAVGFIKELRLLGCKFSLDDFGVGFTSFKYLKEMEVDYIKIDGSFIRKLPESKSDRLIVKSMVDVAQGLGIKTVAEFVENKETVMILREYGVDYAQGYFIGKPAPEILK